MQKNIEQEKAIESLNGPVILISCPGSGKTTTLLRRIDNLINHGARPDKILMITFTKAAAQEMEQKYKQSFGNTKGIMFCTIHALCLRILLTYANFSVDDILKESDVRFFLMGIAKKDRSINDPDKAVRQFLTQYSAAKNNRKSMEEVSPEGISKQSFLHMANLYEQKKSEENKIDFDDMLIKTLELLENNLQILKILQEKWDFIQVDEYQDTNYLQRDIIYLLSKKHRNLCVAGDDDQSIYRFRGAQPEIMLNFQKDFPDATIIKINTNYRSFPGIIKYANRLIVNNKNRFEKEFLCGRTGETTIHIKSFKTQNEQIKAIIKELKESSIPLDDTAILYRNNQQAEIPADLLYKEGIPFKSNEKITDSYETWIWNDIMAYYRAANGEGSKNDIVRILNRPNRYLGPVIRNTQDISESGLIHSAEMILSGWKLEHALRAITQFFAHLRKMKGLTPEAFLNYLLLAVKYKDYLCTYARETNQDEEILLHSVRIFEEDSVKFKNMEQWKAYIMKRSLVIKNKDIKGITLSTMHRAKGLEWRKVYIIDCNEGIIPSNKNTSNADIEEERRLFYVAMTRAKEELCMSYVNIRGTKIQKKSRFLKEIQEVEQKKEYTLKKNDLVKHDKLGICIITDVIGDKCKIKPLVGSGEELVLNSFLQKKPKTG